VPAILGAARPIGIDDPQMESHVAARAANLRGEPYA
jgi:hypothetical protein